MKADEVICRAWEQKKPELLNDIIADSFEWYEDPYGEVITNRDLLLSMWESDLEFQQNISVRLERIVEQPGLCISKWHATFTDASGSIELDGVFMIRLNDDQRLVEFRQWYAKK